MSDKLGLPVHGYKPQSEASIALVNRFKESEERLLRDLDAMAYSDGDSFDQRWIAIARTNLQQGFMALNRAVFQPGRISLPEDGTLD